MYDKQYQRKSFDFLRRYILFYVKHRTARVERHDLDSDRLEDRIVSTLNKASCLFASSSLHSTSRQHSFASVIILLEPLQRFSVRKPTRNYILQHKPYFKTPQSPSVISHDYFQGNSASIQINHLPNCAFSPMRNESTKILTPLRYANRKNLLIFRAYLNICAKTSHHSIGKSSALFKTKPSFLLYKSYIAP